MQKAKQTTSKVVDTIAKSGSHLFLAGFAAYGIRSLYTQLSDTRSEAEAVAGYILTAVTVLSLAYIAHKK